MTPDRDYARSLPSLTVVIPNHNHGHLIGDQLRAVFSQSVQPDRVIVIDDASTDDSVVLIRQLIAPDPNAILICKDRNSGVNAVINEGLGAADTPYVAFLAADDIVMPGLFEKSLGLLARYPEAAVCTAMALVRHDDGDWVIPSRFSLPCSTPEYLAPLRVQRLLLRKGDWYIGSTAIWRKEPLLSLAGFDSHLGSSADNFAFDVLALRHGACFMPEILGMNRRFDTSFSAVSTRDPDAYEKTLKSWNQRMTTSFHDLFSPGLIARINARMLFHLLSVRIAGFRAQALSVVEAVRPLQASRLLVHVIEGIARLARILLFCVLRFSDIPRAGLAALDRWWKRRS